MNLRCIISVLAHFFGFGIIIGIAIVMVLACLNPLCIILTIAAAGIVVGAIFFSLLEALKGCK